MRHNLVFRLAIIAGVTVNLVQGWAEVSQPPAASQVDAVFAAYAASGSPGCAVAVTRGGEILFSKGYGSADLEHQIAITPATAFYAASVSKQFTAASVAILAQQGKLSLDDEVHRFVPELPDFGQRLTIRHLLHHTSGLGDYFSALSLAGWPSDGPITEDDFLGVVSRQKALNFSPGEEYLYSNTGYVLLSIIVKRSSGLSLREFAEAALFRPLEMKGTAFRDDHTAIVKDRAVAYAPRTGGGYRISQPNFDIVGDGGLFTSVNDLARWDPSLLDQKLGVVGLTSTLTTPGRLNDGKAITYALGLIVGTYRGLRVWDHAGAYAGYRTYLIRFPEEHFGVSTLCNVATANPSALSQRVADIYLADRLPRRESLPPPAVPATPPTAISAADLGAYAGLYWNEELEDYHRIVLRDGALMLGSGTRLTALGDGRFRAGDPARTLTFVRSNTGSELQLDDSQPNRRFHRLPDKPRQRPISDYQGSYYSEELDSRWTITSRDGQLVLQRRHVPAIPLELLFDDTFLQGSTSNVVRFTRDATARVTGLTINANRSMRRVRFARISGS